MKFLETIKAVFTSLYELMKEKITNIYIRIKNWLVDTETGEVIDEGCDNDKEYPYVRPTLLDAVTGAVKSTLFGLEASRARVSIKQKVVGFITQSFYVAVPAALIGGLASDVLATSFTSAFLWSAGIGSALLFGAYLSLQLWVNSRYIAVMEDQSLSGTDDEAASGISADAAAIAA